MRWRQGGQVPHNVYRQLGWRPDIRPHPHGDTPLTMFRDPEDAALAVRSVNAVQDIAEMWKGLRQYQPEAAERLGIADPALARILDETIKELP